MPHLPYLIRCAPDVAQQFESEAKLKESLEKFSTLIGTKEAKQTMTKSEGRTQLNIVDDVAKQHVFARVKCLFGDSCLCLEGLSDDTMNDGLKSAMTPSTFAILPNAVCFAMERNFFSYVRISTATTATRVVILVKAVPFITWLAGGTRKPEDLKDVEVRSALKFLTLEQAKSFAQSVGGNQPAVFHTTVASTDALYIPTGYYFAERTSTLTEVFGIRCGVFVPTDNDGLALFDKLRIMRNAGGLNTDAMTAWQALKPKSTPPAA